MKLKKLLVPVLIGGIALAVSCSDMYSDLAENISNRGFGNEITAFSFPSVGAVGIISGNSIAVTVPYGTDVTALVAEFTTTGQSVEVAAMPQISGVTDNDFSAPVTYIVTAADGSTRDYTVTVTEAPSTAKDITSFRFTSALNGGAGLPFDCNGTFTGNNITVHLPTGCTAGSLRATFTTTGQSVAVGATPQVSGVTINDFTNQVTYTVTAADGSTRNYIVTVTIALSTAKSITSFGFTSALNLGAGITSDCTAVITGTTIAVTVPYGTVASGLIATFATTGQSVDISGVPQVSGTTSNDFTNPVTYRVTAADGSIRDYIVTVSENGTLAASSFTTGSSPMGVAVDPVANILYVVNYNSNSVTFFNATTGAYLYGNIAASSFATGSGPYGIALNTSKNTIYIANSGSSTVTYLDATTGALKGNYPTGSYPKGVSVDPAANILYVANQNSGNVTYLNATTGAHIGTHTVGSSGNGGCGINPGANRVYVACTLANTVVFLDAASGAILGTYATSSGPCGIAVNPVENIIYVTCYMSNGVQFFDATTGSNLGFHATGAGPRMGIAVDPAANILYIANMDSNTVRYLNATTGGTLGTYTTGTYPGGVAVNTSMHIIYVTNMSSNTVTFLDAATGQYIY